MLPKVLDRWQVSIATGEPLFDMVFPMRGADGVFHPFLTRIMPLRGRDGKVARWFGTNTDITDQRKIEEELRRASEQRRVAMEAMNSGAWELRPRTRATFPGTTLAAICSPSRRIDRSAWKTSGPLSMRKTWPATWKH